LGYLNYVTHVRARSSFLLLSTSTIDADLFLSYFCGVYWYIFVQFHITTNFLINSPKPFLVHRQYACAVITTVIIVAVHANNTGNLKENYLINPLSPELNPICYLLALLGAHHFLHVSRIRVRLLTFRLLMSYIYGAPILDVSRSHTTTQHSR